MSASTLDFIENSVDEKKAGKKLINILIKVSPYLKNIQNEIFLFNFKAGSKDKRKGNV